MKHNAITNKTIAHTLTTEQCNTLLATLHQRFRNNMQRHPGLDWEKIQSHIENSLEILYSLSELERTGGEPDVIAYDAAAGRYLFADCSHESPSGRRSLCYDQQAHRERKEHKPSGSAMAMAAEMGVTLMSEAEYRQLQTLGEFDTKTSSWMLTPDAIRTCGGALFADRRYDHVFVYHNGASSYYASRGFRAVLWV